MWVLGWGSGNVHVVSAYRTRPLRQERLCSTYRSRVYERDPTRSQGRFLDDCRPEHLASRFKDPTLPPVLATAKAVFTGVEGRRIVFAVTARDETQEIGSGITRARIG
jgi:hypothetical protein